MERDIFEQYKTIKVLALEDIPEDAELTIRELEKAGFLVDAYIVDDENRFTIGLIDFRPDIILADYNLPTITGLEALAIAIEKSPDVPFVFITGSIGEEIAAETILNGASGLVHKSRLYKLPEVVKEIFNREGRWFNNKLKYANKPINNRIKDNLKALSRVQDFLNNREMVIPSEVTTVRNTTIRDLRDISSNLTNTDEEDPDKDA
jgi:CheY-like chemotaxis protein